MKIVLGCSKLWVNTIKEDVARALNCDVTLITQKEELTVEFLKKENPDFVFFPHWSYLIAPEIYQNFKCIIFHMTDLPYGRGGSPLQNLIVRGHKTTKISAFLCDGGLDTGPVYLKQNLELTGTATEIYIRANQTIMAMITDIVKKNLQPEPQTGEATVFQRRTPEQGQLTDLTDIRQIYDHIRMLDAEGYPRAFLATDDFVFEFSEADLSDGEVRAHVRIRKK